MKNINHIYLKELRSYFNGPMAYIFLVIFSIVNGYFFSNTFFIFGQSDMRALFQIVPLVYLFLIIAIGLGCGANQLLIITTGIIFSLIIIVFYSGYLKTSKVSFEEKISAGIIIDQSISDSQIDNIILELKKISKELKFISMSRSQDNTTINLDVRPKNFQNLTKFTGLIKRRFKNSKVILSYNDELSL